MANKPLILDSTGQVVETTTPRVTSIKDTNGNASLDITAAASAVNNIGVENNPAGVGPALAAVGAGSDLNLYLKPKGFAGLVVYFASGAVPSIYAGSPDTNADLNLVAQGTGVLKSNGVPVVTTTAAQALSAKTATLAAGTTAVAPLVLTSGTNLTTPAAGASEYDGTAFYLTPAASTRHVNDIEQFITLTSAYTLANQTAAQKLFNSPTNGAVTLVANTTYFFECCFTLSALSASAHSFGFAFGGTATRTREAWWADAVGAAPGTATASLRTFNTAAQTTLITAGNTATTASAEIKGKIVVGTGGTLIPQVSQLTNAAAAVVGVDSYFRIWTVGANTVQSVGNWS